jgi:hypothetical protein
MVDALREAARRWSPERLIRYVKIFLDQQEYGEIWHRMSMYAPMDGQLVSQLAAKSEGILLPQGNDGKYVKWLSMTRTREIMFT